MDPDNLKEPTPEPQPNAHPLSSKTNQRFLALAVIVLGILIGARFLLGTISERAPGLASALTFKNPDEFKAMLQGHSWLLREIGGEPAVQGVQATVKFQAAKMLGTTGCNNFVALYHREESVFIVAPPTAGRLVCEQPEGIMEQEAALLRYLESSASYSLETGRLHLFDETGGQILVFEPAVIGWVSSYKTIDLPEESVVKLSLSAVVKPDDEPVTLREQIIPGAEHFPFPVAITYNLNEIDPDTFYSLNVQITDPAGKLLFASIKPLKVINFVLPQNLKIFVSPVE